ncbi:hypothetical protein [Hymenobacter rubripertinctus]|uniref:Uncharacterized protein n=1 Tax=Hymenobacter rubripertinctus TaxID=2029981 RepID=A0A418QIA9_9BACT|nr:hypothetical protein [Hymenobacter rubripertinctus]RIY04890.1 hypothetical protein D0T11_21255 [Hymenobacter rubripertinctus]
MSFTITYTLMKAGWAEVEFGDGNHRVSGTASYLHDSLLSLVDAAVLLLAGSLEEQSVIFMDEPGEYQLLLNPISATLLSVNLRWYDDWASWDMCPKDRYQTSLSADSTPLEFATIVAHNLTQLWLTYGSEGYLESWIEHEFPYNQYRKLTLPY